MIALVRSEFLKLHSARSTRVLLLAMIVTSIGGSVLSSIFVPKTLVNLSINITAAISLVPVLILVLGILAVTGEHRHHTISSTYLTTPRRGRVLVAKFIYYTLVGMVMMALCWIIAMVCSTTVLTIRDALIPWTNSSTHLPTATALHNLLMSTLGAGLTVALGVSLGALIRSQLLAIAAALVWSLMVEGIVTAICEIVLVPRFHIPETTELYLPFAAIGQISTSASNLGAPSLSEPTAIAVSLAYVVGIGALAFVLSRRRDVV